MSVTVYTPGFVCWTGFREGNMQLWSPSEARLITSYRFGVPCLKYWTANMWGSFSKLFKDSALFPLTHNKINERCGSGTADGFTGEINTLTQFSQSENQIKIDLLNIECKYPLNRILYTLHILFQRYLSDCHKVWKTKRRLQIKVERWKLNPGENKIRKLNLPSFSEHSWYYCWRPTHTPPS